MVDIFDVYAAYGDVGRIVMSRLDLSGFYPNVIERDLGTRIAPSRAAEKHGFLLDAFLPLAPIL